LKSGYAVKAKSVVVAALAVIVLAAAGGAVYYFQEKHASPAPVPALQRALPPTAPAAPSVAPKPALPPAAAAVSTDCLLPGPPPVPPDGSTATDADMKLGHDSIQTFVVELEAYQACRNAMADHAPPGTTDAQKQALIEQGNAAVDEAHALADAFSAQLKLFHAHHK